MKIIEPGAAISFVLLKRVGKSYRFTSYEGKMVKFGQSLSHVAFKNGRNAVVQTSTIREAGRQNALTEAVLSGMGSPDGGEV